MKVRLSVSTERVRAVCVTGTTYVESPAVNVTAPSRDVEVVFSVACTLTMGPYISPVEKRLSHESSVETFHD